MVGLSNNHILDQGENGLNSTLDSLEKLGVDYMGVGRSLSEASKFFLCEMAGKRIAVYAYCGHEFSDAAFNKAGANPFDPLYSIDHIREAKEKSDYLIILFHGGIEYYRYPLPRTKKICHKMIEAGADLVVMQHSHCVGCREKYLVGEIVYGQGDFLFDFDND